jgi:predicted branched-subunit amino acid permease
MIKQASFRQGQKEALLGPAPVLGIGYIGFGTLANAQGLSLLQAVLSTVCIWALPGQIIFVEMLAVQAAYVAIFVAVMLSAFRFLPMTVSLMPHLRGSQKTGFKHYLAAQFLAMSAWTFAMRRCPDLPEQERLPYYMGFAVTMVMVCSMMTCIGFFMASQMPQAVTMALVISNPIFFTLLLAPNAKDKLIGFAMLLGVVIGPLSYYLHPASSIVVTGLVGGTLAFYCKDKLRPPPTEEQL